MTLEGTLAATNKPVTAMNGVSSSNEMVRGEEDAFLNKMTTNSLSVAMTRTSSTDDDNNKSEDSITIAVDATTTTSSGVRRVMAKDDYLQHTSLQYHWENANLKKDGELCLDFNDYLACFKSK